MRKTARHNAGFVIERCSTGFLERIFIERWMEEDRKWKIFQKLFIINSGSLFSERVKTWITKRDRFIVATIIQWLGTNVGFCWLQETLRQCGYDLVERKDASTLREMYYNHHDWRIRDASAWYNMRKGFTIDSGQLPELKPKLMPPPFRKKHLKRADPTSDSMASICIRCGHIFTSGRYDRHPEFCLWNQESIQKRDERIDHLKAIWSITTATLIDEAKPEQTGAATSEFIVKLSTRIKAKDSDQLIGKLIHIRKPNYSWITGTVTAIHRHAVGPEVPIDTFGVYLKNTRRRIM